MIDRNFFRAGHLPTLLSAFFYFDMSFMVWVLLGPLGVQIANDLQLDAGAEGPDGRRAGAGRRAAARGQRRPGRPDRPEDAPASSASSSSSPACIIAWLLGSSQLLSGDRCSASCSAWPAPRSRSRCRWPRAGIRRSIRAPRSGIAGAGNSGTVFAALFAPGLAVAFGWNNVFGLAAHPAGRRLRRLR